MSTDSLAPPEGWNRGNKWRPCHDTDLDCGAPDLEAALLDLAVRVKYYFGETRERLPGRPHGPQRC